MLQCNVLTRNEGEYTVPEGPEIRRAADAIALVLENQVAERVSFSQAPLRHFGKRFSGARVLEIETRGKAMLTHFAHGWTIYSHNQLYGVWAVAARGQIPATGRSLRLRLSTATHEALLYSASDISVWPTADLAQHPFLARIGPDILNRQLRWQDIAERLRESRFANRQLGALYLDQAFLAGLGNYLRTEILFQAGLHPSLRPAQLTRGEIGQLSRLTLELSWRSYHTGGITNPASRVRKLQGMGLRGEQMRFAAFGRAGKNCYSCGNPIDRIEIGTRRLYLCHNCQPAPA
jgi:endonuclease-8